MDGQCGDGHNLQQSLVRVLAEPVVHSLCSELPRYYWDTRVPVTDSSAIGEIAVLHLGASHVN